MDAVWFNSWRRKVGSDRMRVGSRLAFVTLCGGPVAVLEVVSCCSIEPVTIFFQNLASGADTVFVDCSLGDDGNLPHN